LLDEIDHVKVRFDLPNTAPVVSCYEGGREGFRLHRSWPGTFPWCSSVISRITSRHRAYSLASGIERCGLDRSSRLFFPYGQELYLFRTTSSKYQGHWKEFAPKAGRSASSTCSALSRPKPRRAREILLSRYHQAIAGVCRFGHQGHIRTSWIEAMMCSTDHWASWKLSRRLVTWSLSSGSGRNRWNAPC
jgi:hypothetical protein